MTLISKLGCILLLFIFCASCDGEEMNTGPDQVVGTVTRIVDGDTWYMDSEEVRVRAWGYDTPKCYPDCDEDPATLYLSELILGKHLECEWVEKKMTYNRKVVHCKLDDEGDIGKIMIESGYAKEICRYSKGFYGTCELGHKDE